MTAYNSGIPQIGLAKRPEGLDPTDNLLLRTGYSPTLNY